MINMPWLEQIKGQHQHKPSASLTGLVVAVVLFVLLDLSVLAINLWISWEVEADAVSINLAGRQRMLSQRMTKAALQMQLAGQDEAAGRWEKARKELLLASNLFAQTLQAFGHGGDAIGGDARLLVLKPLSDQQAHDLVLEAETLWKPLVFQMDSLGLTYETADLWYSEAVTKALVFRNPTLLDLMNRLTSRMEAASLKKTQDLRTIQSIAFLLALFNFAVVVRVLYRRYQDAHSHSEDLTKLINQMGAGVAVVDVDGRIQQLNQAAKNLLVGDKNFQLGDRLSEFLTQDGDYWFGYRSDQTEWVAELTEGYLELGGKELVLVTILDVTERYFFAQQMTHDAHHDALTGLPNRRLFMDRLKLALAQLERSHAAIALGVIDLNRFKQINDSHGHALGDLVLVAFAERLRTCIRAGDTLARVGGDEFLLLLVAVEGMQEIELFMERVRASLVAPVMSESTAIQLHASFGFSLAPLHTDDLHELIAKADAAMYEAKRIAHEENNDLAACFCICPD